MEVLTVDVAVSRVEKAEVAAAAGETSREEGAAGEDMVTNTMTGEEAKAPLLSSWPFVGGISAGVFAISITLGVLLARRKIKKGIELYED